MCGGYRRTHRITVWLWVGVTTEHTESLSDSESRWPQNTLNHSQTPSRGDRRTHRITLRLRVWVTTEHTGSLSDSELGWPQNTQNHSLSQGDHRTHRITLCWGSHRTHSITLSRVQVTTDSIPPRTINSNKIALLLYNTSIILWPNTTEQILSHLFTMGNVCKGTQLFN